MPDEALRFDIFAKDEFSKSFDKLKNRLPSIKTLALAAAGGVSALGASLFAIAKTTANAYDSIGKFSDQTGLTTEFLSKMNVAAEFADININSMNKALERLQVGLGEAGKGIGLAKDTLKDMGLSIHQANGMLHTTETILPSLADKFQQMASDTERTEAAQKLFGQRGIEMVKILKDGSEGLARYTEEAEAMGLVIDKQATANAAKFNDALFKVKGSLVGLKNQIAEKIIPIITELSEKFTEFIRNNRDNFFKWGKDLIKIFGEISAKGIESIAFLIDSWEKLRIVWAGLKVKYAEFMNWIIGANTRETEEDRKKNEAKAQYRKQLQDKLIQLEEELSNNYTEGKAAELAFTRDMLEKEMAAFDEANSRKISLQQNLVDEINKYNELLLNPINAQERADQFIESIKSTFEAVREAGEAEIEVARAKNEELLILNNESKEEKLAQQKDEANKEKEIEEKKVAARAEALSKMARVGKVFGKEIFRISQAAGIAEATMNTHRAVAEAIKNPPGPPISFAYGAAALAYGLAQVAAISSQKWAAHGGMTNVPREQTMLIGKGERILSPNQNKDFTNFISGKNGAVNSGVTIENMNILPNATNAELLLNMRQEDWNEIVENNILPALKNLNNRGYAIA